MSNPLLEVGGALLKIGAPIIGGLLQTAATAAGSPLAGKAAGVVLDALGEALGVPGASPEVIARTIEADPVKAEAAARKVEATHGPLADEVQAFLADRQDARRTTVELAQAGSGIAWGAPLVSVVVMAGFAVISYLAIYAPPAQRETLLFLLGAWNGLAVSVVAYWVGSSVGSKDKDALLAALAAAPKGKR